MSYASLSHTELAAQIKKGLAGGYLFFGEEDYLKHHYLCACREALIDDPSLAAFNHIRLEDDTATPEALLDALLTPPVFADKKLIELHTVAWDSLGEKELAAWQDAFAELDDSEDAVLICYADAHALDGGTERAPSKLLTLFGEHLTPVRFARQNDAQLAKWIFRHFQAAGISVTSDLCHQMLNFCGRDMYALSGEIEKVIAYLCAHGRTELRGEDIPLLCCRQTEEDAFAFTNAILDGATASAFALLGEKKARREKPELILGSIFRVCADLARVRMLTDCGLSQAEVASRTGKMHAYKLSLYQKQANRRSPQDLERAVALCEQADLALKRSMSDGYVTIERLIVELGQRKGG